MKDFNINRGSINPTFPKSSIFHLFSTIWYKEAINKINESDSIIYILNHNILSFF